MWWQRCLSPQTPFERQDLADCLHGFKTTSGFVLWIRELREIALGVEFIGKGWWVIPNDINTKQWNILHHRGWNSVCNSKVYTPQLVPAAKCCRAEVDLNEGQSQNSPRARCETVQLQWLMLNEVKLVNSISMRHLSPRDMWHCIIASINKSCKD